MSNKSTPRTIRQDEIEGLFNAILEGRIVLSSDNHVSTKEVHSEKIGKMPGAESRMDLNACLGFDKPLDIGKSSFHSRPSGFNKIEIIDKEHGTRVEIPTRDLLSTIAFVGTNGLKAGILNLGENSIRIDKRLRRNR